MLIGHKRLRIAVVNDPVGIFPAVLHPCHSRRVKLGLRTCQRERECHADIRFAVRFCGVCRSNIHSELVIHRVKAADDLILYTAVVTGLVICVPRSRAVRDLAELDTGHFRLAAVRDRCSRCRQRKAGAQAQKHRAQKQQCAEPFTDTFHFSSSYLKNICGRQGQLPAAGNFKSSVIFSSSKYTIIALSFQDNSRHKRTKFPKNFEMNCINLPIFTQFPPHGL